MSIVVVVQKKGRAVIAADTISKIGNLRLESKYRASDGKILKFEDSYIGTVGAAVHLDVMASVLRRHAKQLSFRSRREIFESYVKLHPILKQEYFINPVAEKDDEYESSQIEALIANPAGIFGMYSWRTAVQYERFFAIGSGREYALGAMYTVYESDQSAEQIAKIGVQAACEFDDGSGLPYTINSVLLRKGKARE